MVQRSNTVQVGTALRGREPSLDSAPAAALSSLIRRRLSKNTALRYQDDLVVREEFPSRCFGIRKRIFAVTGFGGKRAFGAGFLANLICDSLASNCFGEG